jgi:hypothetical protein
MDTSSSEQCLGYAILPQAGQELRGLPAYKPRIAGRTAHEASALQAALELDTTRRGELPAKKFLLAPEATPIPATPAAIFK